MHARGIQRSPWASPARAPPRSPALLGADPVDEPNALVAACSLLYPEARTLIEMGRETQKLLTLTRDEASGRLLMDEVSFASKCAAGSGSFLDHMARRLNYENIAEFARVSYEVESPATLSGRCAVFTESDIVHLYQKGTPRERIAAGVHQAICRNYRSSIVRSSALVDQILFIGGVSLNPAVRKYLAAELKLDPSRSSCPSRVALSAPSAPPCAPTSEVSLAQALRLLDEQASRPLEYIGTDPLSMDAFRADEAGNADRAAPKHLAGGRRWAWTSARSARRPRWSRRWTASSSSSPAIIAALTATRSPRCATPSTNSIAR